MTEWFAVDEGVGAPLVLLHGIGDSHRAWDAVLPALAEHRRVIAFDLPGFGNTAPGRAEEASPPGFAAGLPAALQRLGVHTPVDIVGNSLGGWTALEAAKLGYAKSVVALSPAGLWNRQRSWWGRHSVEFLNTASRSVPQSVRRPLTSTAVGRAVALGVVYGRPWRVPAESAADSVRVMAEAPGFATTVAATKGSNFHGGRDIDVPVTVAFGTRDWILRSDCRDRTELPPRHRWLSLPGCGHVPMWDDPALVTEVILAGIDSANA